jgi:hypothetical protein
VVPAELPLSYNVIVVPSASVLVPLTLVEPKHSDEFTTGVADTACTVKPTVVDVAAPQVL